MRYWVFLSIAVLGTTGTGKSQDLLETGFYHPLGDINANESAYWLAADDDYYAGLCHLGSDLDASLNDPVYAIADGEVYYVSDNGWGAGNHAILVKHVTSDNIEFLALYGHVQEDPPIGTPVSAGVAFAMIGPWDDGTHLHVGIRPNLSIPSTNFGRMPSPCEDPYNGFVDPWDWLMTHSPTGAFECSLENITLSPAGPYVPGQVVSCEMSFRNTGSATWHNDASLHPATYIELVSCNESGELGSSFFYYPCTDNGASMGWLNCISPTSAAEASVSPGNIASFAFAGAVTSQAAAGTHDVYFAPVHQGLAIDGWDQSHFSVNVVEGWLTSPNIVNCNGPADAEGY